MREQNAGFLNVTAGGTNIYYCLVSGQILRGV
jgi:hypothetical protein